MKNSLFPNLKRDKKVHRIKLQNWSPFMKLISWILIVTMLNTLTGCMNYFKVRHATGPVAENIDNFDNQHKTIIVHLENQAWILEQAEVKENALTGIARKDFNSNLTRPVNPKGPNRYRTKRGYNQSAVLNEVHIYTSELTRTDYFKISIPMASIQKIDVYEKDQATTVGSWTLGILGVSALAFLLLMIIVALTKSSCPFIYTFDGENYQLAGEIYSGSIQPQLERQDFLKLPVYALKNKTYQLKIANEVKEIQHTNLMELWVFDHDANKDIWVDKYGSYFTISDLIPATSAINLEGTDITGLVLKKDSLSYSTTLSAGEMPNTDGIILEFPKPEKASVAKLVIRAKNAFVLDYMMGQFQNQFGDLCKKWNKKQKKAPAEKLRQWSLDQNIPLSLSVERNGIWEPVDYFNVAGPMAFKEDILSIPLNDTETNPLRVKLESGTFFWEVDFAGIDYSTDTKIDYQIIQVNTATTQAGKDVRKQLLKDDGKYYVQPEVGDNAVITFNLPENQLKERSIFLHSKGWYQILHDPSGTPDREYLEAFRQPGRFNQFVNEYMQSVAKK
ncbi:MAG TPA: hypothetical protein VKA38_14135 [Draconibacterium sp.]|nr:hypothetical protein [Draconibacterium sp.]